MTAIIACSAIGSMVSCGDKTAKNERPPIDTTLTQDERTARVFTPEVMWKMGRVGSPVISPDGKQIAYTINYYNLSANAGTSSIWMLDGDDTTPVQLTGYDGHDYFPIWHPDGKSVYFLSTRSGKSQIWSVEPDGSGLRQITSIDGDITGFGIAPSANRIWFTMEIPMDKVKSKDIYDDMPLSKGLVYDDLMTRHFDSWEDGHYSHLFVGEFGNNGLGEYVDVTPGEPYDIPMSPYFSHQEIAWNHDGTVIGYTCKKLSGEKYALSTNSDVYLYTVATRETKNITFGMMGYDRNPRFSPDGALVAWESMERAGNESDKSRIFVMDIHSGVKTELTKGFEHNALNICWCADANTIFFTSPIQGTYQMCRVGVSDAQVKVITSGDHDYTSASVSGNRIIATKTTISMAAELFEVDPSNGSDKQLTFVNGKIYDAVDMGRVEKRWIETSDGKQMLTWVIFPPNFDPDKKYPTLLYCQGGPQSVISQRWSYRWNFQIMASQGYIIVAPNRRGLPSFGQEWNDQISGDYSGQNIQDYLSAIDDVAGETWVDKDRLGCVGASYGGYSAFYLAGHHQKRFKAFISHCGMFNFESFYGSTEELWFPNNDIGGPYWDTGNKTAMKSYANSPHKFVNNWDTPMLIFTGINDFRIPYTQSLEAFTAARLHGLDSRLVVFEDENHWVTKPQNSVVWQREFFGWLDKYLKAPE